MDQVHTDTVRHWDKIGRHNCFALICCYTISSYLFTVIINSYWSGLVCRLYYPIKTSKHLNTWILIGWQHSGRPIRGHVRASMLDNMAFSNCIFSFPGPYMIWLTGNNHNKHSKTKGVWIILRTCSSMSLLAHWGCNTMVTTVQTTFRNTFSWKNRHIDSSCTKYCCYGLN